MLTAAVARKRCRRTLRGRQSAIGSSGKGLGVRSEQ